MFCVNYHKDFKFACDAEEFYITFDSADRNIIDFLKKYRNKSIVIDVTQFCFSETDFEFLKNLYAKYYNIRFVIDCYMDEQLILFKNSNVPFFFVNPVHSIDELMGLIKYNPTDIYISNELGFHLDKISKLLHDKNIKIRVFPNICQLGFSNLDSLKGFWIRPEDIPIYETFVDVFELISTNPFDPSETNQLDTIYKIYNSHRWNGKIKEIISNFKGELDNRYLLDSFGVIRSRCGKRCFYKPESCKICESLVDMAKTLEDSQIVIRHSKK